MIRVRVRVRVRRAVVREGGRGEWRLGGARGAQRRGSALGASTKALSASAGLKAAAFCTDGGDRTVPLWLVVLSSWDDRVNRIGVLFNIQKQSRRVEIQIIKSTGA